MELEFLRPLYDRPGPWASVYIDASRDKESAPEEVALRWRGVRRELAAQGVDEQTLVALDRGVQARAGEGDRGLALFAAQGELALAVPLPQPPSRDLAVADVLPRVVPLVGALGEPIAWVRALVDRTGADVAASRGWRRPMEDDVEGGTEWPMHKSGQGGYSQARYERAAETSWERNAVDVAIAVTRAAERVGANIIIVAGDDRARRLLIEHLPERWVPLVVQTNAGSRAPGAAPEPLDEATDEAVETVATRRRQAVLDEFLALGPTGTARTGIPDVALAAREARVRTLLLHPDGLDDRLWVGRAPTDLAREAGELRDTGVTELAETRADEALIRAAAGTDADLVLVDSRDVAEGVGAILRYPD